MKIDRHVKEYTDHAVERLRSAHERSVEDAKRAREEDLQRLALRTLIPDLPR